MIYKQQSFLPIIFQVDENIIFRVNEFLKRNKLIFSNVIVVSGKSFSKKYADQIANQNQWKTYTLEDNTHQDIETLRNLVIQNNTDLIIAVGGGKVVDSVKRVSYLTHVNHLSIPTIISNDGLISPIAVIKNEAGKSESLPGIMPMGVIIDLDIIKSSPINFIRAAAGDILSNISATNDWILAFKESKENINDIAFHLAKSAASTLVHYGDINLRSKPFLRLVIQGQINSGIAMSLAGTSRPCSGSEHLISHAIDYFDLSNKILHGTQVASISLFTLFLQDKLEEKYLNYAKATEIPLNFTSLIPQFSKTLFFKIMDKARVMRPGRYTILEQMDNTELYAKYVEFKNQIE